MSNQTITLTDAAAAIVKADVASFKADRVRYANYVAEMNVTTETVAEHVAIFRDAFKAARGNKNVDGATVKAYATKVRNGLNYQVGKAEADLDVPNYLALVVKAAEKAIDHAVTPQEIRAAIEKIVADATSNQA